MNGGEATAFIIGICIGIAIMGVGILLAAHSPTVPTCAEDEVIHGTGDYSHGMWEHYGCTHPDILRNS